ncbi:hypothetical protein PVMG_01819 [Plasmodium vivax Mauritania I]|uniref:PCIF1 WW domain-containing protein n=1 Tax=Plasmodium vivax Mauritania I TaxID=1035515 RepID=A0A0J9THH1_PLAVI|nr:hypothetical protein PVMG_01819 [Plasmodium vivax Mauritania I]
MRKRSVGEPPRRLDLHKELAFQRETIKLRKALLNAYTFELFYKKGLELKNDYVGMIRGGDSADGGVRRGFPGGEMRRRFPDGDGQMRGGLPDGETSLRKRVSRINREFAKAHQVRGPYHVGSVEMNRHVCFLEKDTFNRFLFSLRIGGSGYSLDERDAYLYRLFVRFVRLNRCVQRLRRERRVQIARGESGRRRSGRRSGRRGHPLDSTDERKDAPLFCDARYVNQFCSFVAPLVRRQRGNPHLAFLKRYVSSLEFGHMSKPQGRERSSSWGETPLRCSVQIGTPQNGNDKRMSTRRKHSPIYMTLSICVEPPTYNLSMHRKRMRTRPLKAHRQHLKCAQHQIKVNGAKVKHSVGRFILGHLYDSLVNSLFCSLVRRSSQLKWDFLPSDVGSGSHSYGEEEQQQGEVFSGGKPHLQETPFEVSEPTKNALSECLQAFFTHGHAHHRVGTKEEQILLEGSVRNLLEDDVRRLLQLTVVNVTLLCERLPLGYLFPVFLFYFLFLNIPLGGRTGRSGFPCQGGASDWKRRSGEEGPTGNDRRADGGCDPPRRKENGVKQREGCLLCLYDALLRNRKMTPLERKKRFVFAVMDALRKSYVEPVDQEQSILSLHFGSLLNSVRIPQEELPLTSSEGNGDEGTHHHSPLCCHPCGGQNTRKRLKLGEGKEANPVKREKWPRCHDVRRIFQRCFERMNRKESILGHLNGLINPKGGYSLNGDCQKGKRGKKKKKNTAKKCTLFCIASQRGRGGQSVRGLLRGDTAKESNPSDRFSKKRGANRIGKEIHSLGASNQLEDEQGGLHRDNRLHEYLHRKGKTFLENLKIFLRPLLSALYRKNIVRVNMYFYLCLVHSCVSLQRGEALPKGVHPKGREASAGQRSRVAPTRTMSGQLSRKPQRGGFYNPVEDYLACKFDRAVHLLCTRGGSAAIGAIAKGRLRWPTSYLQNSGKKLNVWLLLLVYRLANEVDLHTFGGVTLHVSKRVNLSLHRGSSLPSQIVRGMERRMGRGMGRRMGRRTERDMGRRTERDMERGLKRRKINTKGKRRRNVRPYIRRLLKRVPLKNYSPYAHRQEDCFYIQRKNDVVVFNFRSKGGGNHSADAPNVYYQFDGKNYFVHEREYMAKRACKIKCVNLCLLFYRYCFFFYKRNPLVFSFLFNRVFCVCPGCLGRYLVLGRAANLGSPPAEDPSYRYHSSFAICGPPAKDATPHDCFYKQIGMLIKNRKNIFVRHFHFLALFLMMRYHTLVGNVRHSGLQSCVPKRVMTLLRRKLKIKRECFSSPLNAVLPSYCSFFPDIDTFFGSSGNFFEFPLRSGAYEVNPPFDVYLINQLIVYILHHLRKEEHQLTFFLVIPMLQDKNYFFELLSGSPYLSAHFLLARNSYTFSTRLLESREEEYISTCDCFVFILQNEKAKIQKGVINKKVALKIKKRWENLSNVKQKKGISWTDRWTREESDP